VVVTGGSARDSEGDYPMAYYTAKYAAADGALIWEQRYNGPGNGTDIARTAVVERSGDVAVSGISLGSGGIYGLFTAKYAAADGALLWTKRFATPGRNADYGDTNRQLAITPDGGVAITASSPNGKADFLTVKYVPVETTTLAATGVGTTTASPGQTC
jgi:hypothetical protein